MSDIRHRYAGSALGWFWLIVVPLAQIAIFSLVFSRVMEVRLPELEALSFSFTVYLCSGLLPFLGFSDTVSRCTSTLVTNSRYIAHSGLPETVLFAREALSGWITTAIGVALLLVLAGAMGLRPTLAWLSVPAIVTLMLAFAFGLGMVLGVLNAFTRDVNQVVAVMLQLWLWATPIVYVETVLPEALRTLLVWNPLYPFIDSMHRAVLFSSFPSAAHSLAMVAWVVVTWSVGSIVLRRLQPQLRDVI